MIVRALLRVFDDCKRENESFVLHTQFYLTRMSKASKSTKTDRWGHLSATQVDHIIEVRHAASTTNATETQFGGFVKDKYLIIRVIIIINVKIR